MGRGLLIIVSGLFIVYGIIQKSLNERQRTMTRQSADYAVEANAKTIANSMADLAFAEVNQHPNKQFTDSMDFENIPMLNGKGTATISTVYPFAPSNPFVEQKVINAKGVVDGKEVDVKVVAQRRAFSKYSYFTVEEPVIYFNSGDVLNGPVHTNGTFHIYGDPVFNGRVTSPNKPIETPGSDPEYKGGSNFNAHKIDFPVKTDKISNEAKNGGLSFDKPIKIDFFNDNTTGKDVGKAAISTGTTQQECTAYYYGRCYRYKTVTKWSDPTNYNLSDYNGLISSSENVELEGTLNGNYTVHSEKNIDITGDIRYFDDPTKKEKGDPASDDFLGIVSEGQTKITRDAHKKEGSKDIDIQASIMALSKNNSFSVEGYDDGDSRGMINLYGGLIQYQRGPVGLVSGSGYDKNYTYDERFLGKSPKGFPPTGIYDYISWQTSYK